MIGIAGACRLEELPNMLLKDIDDKETMLVVNIPNTKTNVERKFVVVGVENLIFFKEYVALRPLNVPHDRLFVYYKQGKCTSQPVGINTFESLPCKVAEYLKLPNANEYTEQCLRRSSATMLVEGGGNITNLKRHGGWKSSSVAEGYIEDSMKNKIQIANRIQNGNSTDAITPNLSSSTFILKSTTINNHQLELPYNMNFTNCNNFTININK